MARAERRGDTSVGQESDTWRIVELLASVVAPPTLVAALLYWFGLQLTLARTDYFGLGLTTLGYSTIDYVIRGVEAGIVPLIVLMLVVLVTVVVYVAANEVTQRFRWAPWFHATVWTVLGCCVAVTLVGAYAVFRPLPGFLDGYLLPPVLLAVGPLAGLYVVGQLSPASPRTPAWTRVGRVAVTGLVVLSVFWGVSLYAQALGRGRAEGLAARLAEQPGVILYSERSLGIDPTVAGMETPADAAEGRYPYRYVGLRLLTRSNGKYFLLPESWTPDRGTVLVIPDVADIRVEFFPGG